MLTDKTWEAFGNMIKANQPHDDWHFVTIPAENCRGKDMRTPQRCKSEALKALREEAMVDYENEFDESQFCQKITEGKYNTSVHGLVCADHKKLLSDSQTEQETRHAEIHWRCPHNWAGARGACYFKSDGKTVRLFTASDG